ncbi:MAG TPA: proton-conducting transporter membrane subunit, partial [Candidatus Dormibacteraeota bacterium]|nr:proton-conducting transporter membrane subunit [Candidatus Dormibacteraeota bacterium]
MPALLISPLVWFVLAISSIRTRRSAASAALLGTIVSLALTLLVGWGLTRKSSGVFNASYAYINMSVAFTGPSNFQTFAIDLTMHADKLVVAALFAIEVCMIGALAWNQTQGRNEPGAARFYAMISALLFTCTGILLSQDLAELFAFWVIGGALTYLLLEHRWGSDEPAERARIALALPLLTDLCLLCGIGWLYSRYGVQNITAIAPILHTNPGWTVRSIVLGAGLLFVGVGGRLALWPLSTWITETANTAPPAGWAIVQASWSVVAIVLLYRLMPIFTGSSEQFMHVILDASAGVGAIAALLALADNQPRRILALTGSAAGALGCAAVLSGFHNQPSTYAIAGVAAVIAIAPARTAAILAVSSISAAMRTDDLAEMGDAWNRMRASSLGLLVSTLLIGLGLSGALALAIPSRSRVGFAIGEAVLLVALGGVRVFMAVSFGELRRRRAFEPDRVREAPRESTGWPYWLALASAVLIVASLFNRWLNFLDGLTHPALGAKPVVLWAAVAVA